MLLTAQGMVSTILLLQSAVFAAKMGPSVVAAHEICRMTFILQYIVFAAVELTGQSMVAGRLAEEEEGGVVNPDRASARGWDVSLSHGCGVT